MSNYLKFKAFLSKNSFCDIPHVNLPHVPPFGLLYQLSGPEISHTHKARPSIHHKTSPDPVRPGSIIVTRRKCVHFVHVVIKELL